MNVAAVKQKREERLNKLAVLNEQIKKLKADDTYSEAYKASKLKELETQKQAVNLNYDNDIKALIESARDRYYQEIDEENYKGDNSKKLLIEMQNQKLAEQLYRDHKANGGEGLVNEAHRAVRLNLSHAPAYVEALKRIEHKDHFELETALQVNSRTPLQKEYYKQLEELDKQSKAYEVDVMRESNPLSAAIASKAYGIN